MVNRVKTFCESFRRIKTQNAIRMFFRSDDMLRLKLSIFCLVFVINTALPSTGLAATYYVDAQGTSGGSGTSDDPYHRQGNDILNLGQPGDVIYLQNGYYGIIDISARSNSDYITIQAQPGHNPEFKNVTLRAGSKWVFRGLTISPELAPTFSQGTIFYIENCTYITVDNCTIYSKWDSSSWDASDWNSYKGHGLYSRVSATHITFRNNYIKNVQSGIVMDGSNSLAEYNTVENFAGDGCVGNGDDQVWQYNIVMNSYDVDDNHDDLLQIAPGPNYRIEIRGNIFISGPDPNNPLRSGAQGICLWDGPNYGIIIENNIVINDHGGHGIKCYDCQDSVMINNIAVNHPHGASRPEIGIGSKEKGGNHNVTIRNNIAHGFGGDPPDATKDHNLDVDNYNWDELFVNWSNYDLRHVVGSPAIDAGSSLLAPNIDIIRTSRPQGAGYDIGAYECVLDPNNQAPDANAGPDQIVTDSDGNGSEQSTLDGSGSNDPDGNIVSWVWTDDRGDTIPDGETTTATLSVGTHTITLTVTDDDGATDTDTVIVIVNPGNQAPTADAGPDQTVTDDNGNGSESVDLDGSGSTDSDGTIQSYVWSEGGTQITTGVSPNVTLSTGQHTITLTVTDDDSATDTDTVTITINEPANQAPTANAGSDQTVTDSDGNGSQQITLDGSGSTDSDGTIQSYVWSEGGTQIATGVSPNVTLSTGQHTITLTVTDNDGATDTDTVTVTINALDTTAPSVTNYSPVSDAIQVPLNNLVTLHVVDAGKGVDANLVTIQVNNNAVYTGNTTDYNSDYGHCRRTGTKADYAFIYQPSEMFDFDQTVTVTVNATDLANNTMNEYSYSFKTEMRSFGENKMVNSGSDGLSEGGAATVPDSSGNIWAAWHAGPAGSRDIYVGKLVTGADNFGNSIQLTDNTADQYNAAIAVDADDKLYVVWQDNRQGNWDIYLSTSTDGINWSTETRVTDSNDNQTNPGIVIDSSLPRNVYIVWQDDRDGNQDIYIASSSNDFLTETISQITSDVSDQTEPAVAVDSGNVIYVVWTDTRGGSSDIYGAASNSGPWTNVAIVSNANNQSSPAIATEAVGSILHLLWVDDTSGDQDIYYAASNGLSGSPLSGSSIIDDTSGSNQSEPVIVVTGSTGDSLKVFACWQDTRNSDIDLYLDEITSSSGTDVFVDDDSTNTDQSEPAMGTDIYGHPYLIWVDNRNTNADIYYAGSTFTGADVLAAENVSPSTGVTVGTEPSTITGVDDVSVVVPAGAYSCDITITISRVENPPSTTLQRFSLPYDFGPSGIEFDQPVTITIPYEVPASGYSVSAYWYNQLTDAPSQEGITNVETIVISPTLYALSFETTHFTQFFVGGSSSADSISGGGGGGGGGCSISAAGEGSIVEFLLPYIGLAVVMVVIKCRDVRNCKARSIT